MATKTTGLHERPTYNKLIREIQHGEKSNYLIGMVFLRNSPYLAFLDGQGTTEMAEQQERVQKQVETEHVVRNQAASGGGGAAEARVRNEISASGPKMDRMLKPVNRPQSFNIADEGDVSMDETAEHEWKASDLMDEVTGGGGQPPGMGGGGRVKGGKGKAKTKETALQTLL